MAARNQADGFRIIARKDGKRVKLYSRPGNDLSYRFPLVVEVIFGSFRAHFAHVCVSPGDSDPNRGPPFDLWPSPTNHGGFNQPSCFSVMPTVVSPLAEEG